MRKLALVFLLISNSTIASTTPPPFPEEVKIGSESIPLHGWGVRTATLFGFRVYEAAFYNASTVQNATEVIESRYPKRIEIRYLRDVSLPDVKKAWEYQFKDSVPENFEGIKTSIELLNSWQAAIREGDTHRFDIYLNEVRFAINGEEKGSISGTTFRDSVILLFFGEKPPTKDLKRGLLTRPRRTQSE